MRCAVATLWEYILLNVRPNSFYLPHTRLCLDHNKVLFCSLFIRYFCKEYRKHLIREINPLPVVMLKKQWYWISFVPTEDVKNIKMPVNNYIMLDAKGSWNKSIFFLFLSIERRQLLFIRYMWWLKSEEWAAHANIRCKEQTNKYI